ncbi:MAG: tRNA (N(6)-L-threonylcarbamoyladenosine(37)-C(2))-methylthiotransferase MtaB [Angelakisella sp.]
MIRISFFTLGCKVNQYETQALSQRFSTEGFLCCPEGEDADVYIINSCTVTAQGDRKTRQLLRRLRREHPEAAIALTGCYPQAFPEEATALTEVDILTGSKDRGGLVTAVRQFLATRQRVVAIQPHRAGDSFEAMSGEDSASKTRAFIKIEDGCENFCAYCIIPYARGPVRSKPMEELHRELLQAVAAGHREVVLLGINLGSYGRDTGKRLIDAIELSCSIEGIDRVRLGSVEPDLLTPEDIRRMSVQEKFCPQFHLSLQSGCDTVLTRMGRHYTTADYLAIVSEIRRCFPDAALTTDMMVGFPGESDQEFDLSVAFARQIGFAKIHAFVYSPRTGTPAATMSGQVTSQVKKQRINRLLAEADSLRTTFLQGMVGSVQQVLFEGGMHNGVQTGYTKNYTPVSVCETEVLKGNIISVLITEVAGDGCTGILMPV